MRRTPPSPLVWQESDEGESAGEYAIRLESPHHWELLVRGRSAGVYPTRATAREAAGDVRRRRRVRRALAINVAVAVASLAVLSIAMTLRTRPNPDYPPARAIADRFDQARDAVEAGEMDIEDVGEQFDGIAGSAFQHAGLRKLGLAGVFDGDCYGMVWRSGFPVAGTAFRTSFATCAPDQTLIDQPADSLAEPLRPSWDFALPDQTETRVWFIPLVALSFAVLLGAALRALALLPALRR